MIQVRNATTDADFEQMLALQRRNLRSALSAQEQAAEGFVYLEHDVPVLRRMAAAMPQAIAVAEGRVVGYCLALALELRADMPNLEPMFQQFARAEFRGRPLLSHRFFVGGQVCVDRDFRRRGLAGALYRQACRSAPQGYALCVTEIAARNVASLGSHAKIGFETVLTYSDGSEDWVVVALDMTEATR